MGSNRSKNIFGQELVDYIKLNHNCLTGLELLTGLLKQQLDTFDISDMTWFKQDKYGSGLKKLFESNTQDQIIGLLMFQNYCSKYKFPKIESLSITIQYDINRRNSYGPLSRKSNSSVS